MKEDCRLFDSCQVKYPILKPAHLKRTPTDFYHPSWCNFCRDYQPIEELKINRTIYLENLTDGQFLKLQSQVNTLSEKVNTLTIKKKKQYKEYDTK